MMNGIRARISYADDYVCYEPPHYVSDVGPLPALENGYITFGNLNSPAKTNEYSLDLWSEVLKEVPNSRCCLLCSLKRRSFEAVVDAFKNGIGEDRLIIEYGAGHQELLQHIIALI